MLCHLGHKHPDQDHLETAAVEVVLEFMPWGRTSHQVEEEEEGRWMIKALSFVAWIGNSSVKNIVIPSDLLESANHVQNNKNNNNNDSQQLLQMFTCSKEEEKEEAAS